MARVVGHSKSVVSLHKDHSGKNALDQSKAILPSLSVSQLGSAQKGLAGHSRGNSFQHASTEFAFASVGRLAEESNIMNISNGIVVQLSVAQNASNQRKKHLPLDKSHPATAFAPSTSLR